ncbi:hypothetical protein EDC94DRAFT_590799 [Helicostylum pulchrum]|nr:hypothetical protein EDC94DRAFT_590799 [Helicostylum pulchrum]
MSSELIKQLAKNAKKKQIIELKLQEQELVKAHRVISTETSAADTVKIKGLCGTLGDNLIRLASKIVANNIKDKYFLNLSKNCIIDITNDECKSQIALLGGSSVKHFLEIYKYGIPETYNLKSPFLFDKVDGIKSLKAKYRQLDMYQPKNRKEAVLKRICVRILYQNAYLPLSGKCFKKRYWVNIFEYYFGRKDMLLIQSGDTVALRCKKSKLMFKLDVRILAEKDGTEFDLANGEIASVSGSTKSKYYKDALKLALSSKQHLNHILSSLPNITAEEIASIKLPIIQIMGLTVHISCLSVVDKNLYVLQDVYSFNYPKNIKEIKGGAIGRMMTGLLLIDDMISNIDNIYEDFSCNTGDKIDDIKSEENRKKKVGKCDEYISSVIWDSSGEDDNDDSSDEDDDFSDEDDDDDNNSTNSKDGYI